MHNNKHCDVSDCNQIVLIHILQTHLSWYSHYGWGDELTSHTIHGTIKGDWVKHYNHEIKFSSETYKQSNHANTMLYCQERVLRTNVAQDI